MKHMKKVASLLMAMAMILTMTVTSFADEELGSITITGVGDGTVYEIYKLLDLESYDTESGAYSYKVNSAWTTFFASATATPYFAVDEQAYATWIGGDSEEAVAAFAKLALAYAKENELTPVQSSENEGEFALGTNGEGKATGTFSNLELGYYLIDSTMGALCGLTTTNPDAYVNAKNGIPTIDKQVLEDSTNQWGGENTADIGQTVEYRVTINVHAGAENYVLHDTMVDGLTFKEVTKIEHVIPGSETHTTTADKYTVKKPDSGVTDGCDFEVHFTKEFCDSLKTNDKVVIHYTAMLNRHAVIADDGNENKAWLTFGEGGKSNEDSVFTETYAFDLVKSDSQNKLIDGAEFRIYDAATGGNEVNVVLMDDGETYRRARADEPGVNIVVKNGKVRVVGFDNGTYYLQETVTPEGYNSLAARHPFTISDENLDATIVGNIVSTNSGVHVVNKSGTMLPETGGMGTVMFITCGSVLVMAAGVLLVTKKRMSMIQD